MADMGRVADWQLSTPFLPFAINSEILDSCHSPH